MMRFWVSVVERIYRDIRCANDRDTNRSVRAYETRVPLKGHPERTIEAERNDGQAVAHSPHCIHYRHYTVVSPKDIYLYIIIILFIYIYNLPF